LSAPSIVDKDFKQYKKAITKGPKIMPKYSLIDEELKAIFFYINELNRETKSLSLKKEMNSSIKNDGIKPSPLNDDNWTLSIEDIELNQ